MKSISKFLTLGLVCVSMTSCYTSRVAVGQASTTEPVYEVNKFKNHAFIGGLVPLSEGEKASEFVGQKTNYVVKHELSFVDGLLGIITFGIYTPSTTTYYLPVSDK